MRDEPLNESLFFGLDHARGKAAPTRWAAELLAKKPHNVVAVALANKMARIVWSLMTTGRRFEASAAA